MKSTAEKVVVMSMVNSIMDKINLENCDRLKNKLNEIEGVCLNEVGIICLGNVEYYCVSDLIFANTISCSSHFLQKNVQDLFDLTVDVLEVIIKKEDERSKGIIIYKQSLDEIYCDSDGLLNFKEPFDLIELWLNHDVPYIWEKLISLGVPNDGLIVDKPADILAIKNSTAEIFELLNIPLKTEYFVFVGDFLIINMSNLIGGIK